MKNASAGAEADVHRVHGGVQQYAQELLAENDRLRVLLAALESERTRLEERARSIEDVLGELDVLRAAVGSLERDKLRLQERLLQAQNSNLANPNTRTAP